jgi:hypothetical protein
MTTRSLGRNRYGDSQQHHKPNIPPYPAGPSRRSIQDLPIFGSSAQSCTAGTSTDSTLFQRVGHTFQCTICPYGAPLSCRGNSDFRGSSSSVPPDLRPDLAPLRRRIICVSRTALSKVVYVRGSQNLRSDKVRTPARRDVVEVMNPSVEVAHASSPTGSRRAMTRAS